MEIRKGYDSAWLGRMLDLYNRTELKRPDGEKLDRAFKGSTVVVSAWFKGELVGIGRMISDGAMNSAIFDLVVDPEHQGKGIGKAVMQVLMSSGAGTRIYLGATFGKEGFYYRLGFRKHRTAMGCYPQRSPYLDYDWKPPEEEGGPGRV